MYTLSGECCGDEDCERVVRCALQAEDEKVKLNRYFEEVRDDIWEV